MAVGAAILAAILFIISSGTRGGTAIIYLNGEEYARMPLNKAATLKIEQGNEFNIIITDGRGGVQMQASSCKNQLCVDQGRITAQSSDNSRWIICLPNGISICIGEDKP